MASVESENTDATEVLDFPEHLRKLFQRMRNDESLHDVVFVVQNQQFSANRCVLAAASPVFRRMFRNGMKETEQCQISLPEVKIDAWKMVLDYLYTAQVRIEDIDSALECLVCANRFLVEDLELIVSNYIGDKLDNSNCCRILAVVDRINLPSLRQKTMKYVCDNFYSHCFSTGIELLPFEVILEILKNADLVVRSELDVLKAVLRWCPCLGVEDVQPEINVQIVARASELLVKFKALPDDYTTSDPELCNTGNYPALFDCVNINNMNKNDLLVVVRFCRQFCAETQENHKFDLIHLRKFGDKSLDKLLEMSNSIPNLSTLPYDRVPHGRDNEIFTFSYTFYDVQSLLGQSSGTYGRKSLEFIDGTGVVKWHLLVYFRGQTREVRDEYVSVYLYRNSEDVYEEDMEFGSELFAEIEKHNSPSDSNLISAYDMNDRTQKYGKGAGYGYAKFLPISSLQGNRTITFGANIYTKPK